MNSDPLLGVVRRLIAHLPDLAGDRAAGLEVAIRRLLRGARNNPAKTVEALGILLGTAPPAVRQWVEDELSESALFPTPAASRTKKRAPIKGSKTRILLRPTDLGNALISRDQLESRPTLAQRPSSRRGSGSAGGYGGTPGGLRLPGRPAPGRGPGRPPAPEAHAPAPKPLQTARDSSLRRLRVDVADGDGRSRHFAFAAGRNTLRISIGSTRTGIAADKDWPENEVRYEDGVAALHVEVVVDTPTGTVIERRPMLLPDSGNSSIAEVDIDIPPGVRTLTAAVLVFQRATLLQSARLRGPVRTKDTPRRSGPITLTVDAEVSADAAPPRAEVDASLSFHVGRPGEVLLVDGNGDHRLLRLSGLTEFRNKIITALIDALNRDDFEGATPGSDQQVEMLRKLARLGNDFHQAIASQLGSLSPSTRMQVISADDDLVPLEFTYDFGMPTATARLCTHWRTALQSGRCRCRPAPGLRTTVCPLGFWGLRYVLERQIASDMELDGTGSVAGQLRPGHETLPDIDRVLFAATVQVAAVKRDELHLTRQALQRRLGARAVEATSWRAWHAAVRTHRPGVLLALPHADEVDGVVALQIGRNSRREVGGLTPDYVVAPGSDVGPVVLLLGCSTAVADISWQSAAAAFRRRGASIVVGTIVETLGRQSAPLARHLAALLWGAGSADGETIGEVLAAVRRQSVASGTTLGMSLVAFGQTGWLIPRAGS